jgi:hypothetical protein
MPIVFLAFIDGLHRLPPGWRPAAVPAATGIAVTIAVTGLGPGPALWETVDPAAYRVPADVIRARQALKAIPDGATVAAANQVAAQLTSRCRVLLFPDYPRLGLRPQFVAVTTDSDPTVVTALTSIGYRTLTHGGHVVVYQSTTPNSMQTPSQWPNR